MLPGDSPPEPGEDSLEHAQGSRRDRKAARDLGRQIDELKRELKAIQNQHSEMALEISNLKKALEDLARAYGGSTTSHNQLTALVVDEFRPLAKKIDFLCQALPRLIRQVEDQGTLVQRHEQDFQVFSADATRQREDLGSEAHRLAVDLADRFSSFWTQSIRPLANSLTRGADETGRDKRRAELVRDITRILFPTSAGQDMRTEDPVAYLEGLGVSLDPGRAGQLADEAAAIAATAAGLRIDYFWNVDDAWVMKHSDDVDFWPGCAEDAPVAFVVRPALIRNGTLVRGVIVYT